MINDNHKIVEVKLYCIVLSWDYMRLIVNVLFQLYFQGREKLFKERRAHVIKECLREGRIPEKTSNLRYNNIPSSKAVFEMTNGILYCPILKVGSTFLNRILVASSSNRTLKSPFETERRHAPSIHRLDKLNELYSKHEVNKAMKNSISFMAVRDPYTKLFSGYADKLFHPNFLFWKLAGQKIQWLIRDRNITQQAETLCGHDISFVEFVKYIIHTYEHHDILNAHFVTLHKPCDPCLIQYDYILKMESFKDDTMFLLNVLRERYGTEIQFSNFEQETAIDNARRHIRICFQTINKYGKTCNIPTLSFLLRTWRYFQMSGIISKTVDLPVENESVAMQMTQDEFTSIVNEVISATKNWTEVKMQRQEALLQAYRSVDMVNLEKLREIMEDDCRYFDYDCGIEKFHTKHDNVNIEFDYFDAF